MRTWFVRTLKKYSPGFVSSDIVDAQTAEEAASQVEKGPVRFWYKDQEYTQYLGVGYLYEVREL